VADISDSHDIVAQASWLRRGVLSFADPVVVVGNPDATLTARLRHHTHPLALHRGNDRNDRMSSLTGSAAVPNYLELSGMAYTWGPDPSPPVPTPSALPWGRGPRPRRRGLMPRWSSIRVGLTERVFPRCVVMVAAAGAEQHKRPDPADGSNDAG
jgi:hypothetical protein